MNVVVDTNILFSILLGKNNTFMDILLSKEGVDFYCPRFAIVELFKHKEKIVTYSNLRENKLFETSHNLLQKLRFYDEQMISKQNIQTAYKLCVEIDIKDAPFVALTFELQAKLWTGDQSLMLGLQRKGIDIFFNPYH
jgi:predicted nucleic acid-binding protein